MMFPTLALAAVLMVAVPSVVAEVPLGTTTLPPVIPWATFSEASTHAVGGRIGRCPDGRGALVGVLQHQGDLHVYYFDAASQRLQWVYRPGGEEPTWVGTGQVADPPRHDIIPPLQWVTVETAKTRWPGGPCDYLGEGLPA